MERIIRYFFAISLLCSLVMPATTSFAADEIGAEEPIVTIESPDELQAEKSNAVLEPETVPPAVIDGPITQLVEADPLPQPDSAKLLISEVRLRGCLSSVSCADTKEGSFIELYNPSPTKVTVHNLTLQYVVANDSGFGKVTTLATIDTELDGYSYLVAGNDGLSTRGAVFVPMVMGSTIGNASQGYVRLIDSSARVIDLVGWSSKAFLSEGGRPAKPSDVNNSMQRCEDETGFILDTDDNTNDFLQYDFVTPGTGIRCVAPAPVVEVNECQGIIISEIAANVATEQQFIELHNTTTNSIAVGGCQLQTNRSVIKTFILPDEIIPGGSYRAIYIQDSDLVLTKTTNGIVYLLSSDGQSETDTQKYANLAVDTSWSWFADDVWQQTYAVTPGSSNTSQPYLPCDEGYVRNLETGRCNKIVVTTVVPCADNQYRSEETGRCRTVAVLTSLTLCKDGQYRSEETNRCRNIALAGSTLTPCKDNQYRSEETNRCRSVAAASANLAPCKDNQYRSEETNRCRNIAVTAIPEAAFAVTPVRETGKAFVGWWALGGIGLLAVGYGAWEWRREVVMSVRRVRLFFTSHR